MKKDKKIIYGLSFLIVLGASASIDYIKDYIQTPAVVAVEDDEKNSGEKIMPCVSRFEGKTLVLNR